MLIVVAPSSSAIWTTSAVYSSSERVASMGENSTSSVYCFECATAALAWPFTSSRVVWSWYSMWMSLVEMKVGMRGRSESRIAFQAASMSWKPVRASAQITGPCTSRAIAWTASKSPGEAIGKPASMMSTPRRESWCAISSFSFLFSEMPGDCSPSRSVVSKMRTWSVPSFMRSLSVPYLRSPRDRFAARRPPRAIPPEGGGGEVGGGRWGTSSALLSLHREHNFPDVLALAHVAVRVGAALERECLGDHRPDLPFVYPTAQ